MQAYTPMCTHIHTCHTQAHTLMCAHIVPIPSSCCLFFPQIKSNVNRKNAKYVLQGEFAGKIFGVDANTGDVLAFERLDREKVPEYFLTALIVDKNTNANLEQPSSFTIKVHDINDNWPVFTRQVFNASVPERSAIGTCLVSPLSSLPSSAPAWGHPHISHLSA